MTKITSADGRPSTGIRYDTRPLPDTPKPPEPRTLTCADLHLAAAQAALRDLDAWLVRYRTLPECDVVHAARKALGIRIASLRRQGLQAVD